MKKEFSFLPARQKTKFFLKILILKEIIQITAVHDGMDALEGYEIVFETADMKDVEITVAPDGKTLEDSGEKKPQER
jgi:hypothetical protein